MLVTRNKIVQTSRTDIKSSKVFEKFTDGTILPVNGAGCQNRINYVLSNHINSSSILQKRLQMCISNNNNNNIIENYNNNNTNTHLLPNRINYSSTLRKRLQMCISNNNNNIIENYNILLYYTNTHLLPNDIVSVFEEEELIDTHFFVNYSSNLEIKDFERLCWFLTVIYKCTLVQDYNYSTVFTILQKRLQMCISNNNNNIIDKSLLYNNNTNTHLLPNEIIVELLNIVNNILSRITIIETNDIVKSLHFYGSKLTKDSKLLSKAIDYVLNNLPNSSNIHFDNLWQVQSWIDPRGFEAKFATFSDKEPFMKIYSYGSKEFGFANVHTYDGDFILRMPKQLRCELQAWYNEDSKDFRKTVIPVLERIFVSSKVKCDATLDTECDCSLTNLLNALKVSKNRKNIDVSNITLDKSAILHDIEELLNFYITVFHITEAEEARAREYIINNINDDSENDYFK